MNPFIPEFDGQLELARIPDDFIARIRKRVEEGLLLRGNRRRANYAVRSAGSDEITFGAEDFLTAYNVGLNDVSVRRSGAHTVSYHVTFWRWTWTAVAHGAILGLVFLISFLFVQELRRDVAAYDNGPLMFWGIVVFFCLLWPWILTAIHRKFAEKALQHILRDVMS